MVDYLLTNEETERLLFRKVTAEDFKDWLPFHENPISNQYWAGLPTDPKIACQQQLDKTLLRYNEGSGGLNALISKKDHQLIGLSGLLVQEIEGERELELGYSILPNFWRVGYAFDAANRVKKVAFDKQWAESLISIIHKENIPSQKTALKLGMSVDFTTTYFNNPVDIYRIYK
jgi:RimJ/RimL family protein N-acetyltransferase